MLWKMEIINLTTQKILTLIIRNVSKAPTLAMLAESLKMTHVGIWKAVKKLEAGEMVKLKQIGNKKNSIYEVHLNWENPLLEKTLILALEHEATSQRRWAVNFAELKELANFVILYGSILHSPQKANDVDIMGVISKKNNFSKFERIVMNIQKTQLKKIHAITFSPGGLNGELNRPNIAFINAIKEGVILFGQDKFVAFLREFKK